MKKKTRLIGGVFLAALLGAGLLWWGQMRQSMAQAPAIGGCQMFPSNHIWNTPINTLPRDASSDNYVASIGQSNGLKADFGAGLYDGNIIGIPYTVVPAGQPKVNITFDYDEDSDPGPYPIPPNPPIEGGSDHHVLIVEQGSCKLYEIFDIRPNPAGGWLAGSGAIFPLTSNALRPAGWTSADAAGLSILAGLVRYDEVAAGSINHALRFTAPASAVRTAYIWPGRHLVNNNPDLADAPLGQRFRLKASFNVNNPAFSPQTRVILTALKTYGMFLSDIGSSWFLSGAPDNRWDNDMLTQLGQVKGLDFEAVDESFLWLDPNSAQAASIAAPSGLQTTAFSSAQINLAWADNSDIEGGFYLERKTGPTGAWSRIATLGPNVLAYQDTGRAESTLYYYRVQAFFNNALLPTAFSNEAGATTLLVAPSGLTAVATSSTQVNLNWIDHSGSESGFTVERKTQPGGTFGPLATVASNLTSYQDQAVTGSTTYSYRVRAYNGVTQSAWTGPVDVTTPPNAPSGLAAWATSTSQVKLRWSDNSANENGFAVEGSPDGLNSWTSLAGSPTAPNVKTLLDSSLPADTTHFYRVRAFNAAGPSAWAGPVSATTTVLIVRLPSDDGAGMVDGTLSFAFKQAQSGQSILFSNLLAPANKISFEASAVWTPDLKAGVTLLGNCAAPITIDGSGLPPDTDGLHLKGKNKLIGVKVLGFPGQKLVTDSPNNFLDCVAFR